ncbi:CoxG family protein [Halofilum ochraceum]|uniref:CoxG family protein n=1 Tax=Halofilum ochraceum TaxID=1611323 RepID=UPI00082AE82F|nr:carbon monoxide dehydrogenase subunit G [Halofilum ochraceum]
MELQQERHVPLPRETVWEALNDPDVLKACIPGCESFERVDDGAYEAAVKAKVGPVNARFKGNVTLTDLNPPTSYSMSFKGQGGQAGFVKGSADVTLTETDGGCTVGYTAKAQLGGKLAQLGSRLVDGAARKTANEFFDNFVEYMGGSGEEEEEANAGAAAAETGEGPGNAPARIWTWAAVGAGVVVIVLAFALL